MAQEITVSRSNSGHAQPEPAENFTGAVRVDRPFGEWQRLWRDAVNRRSGDVTVAHLPEVGIRGNTHFPFSDLNNVQIADEMSTFLSTKKLD